MEKFIQQNIYAFYDKIGSSLETGFYKTPHISWLNSGNGNWPNMIYNTSFEENNLDEFVADNIANIKAKKAPPFWLTEDSDLDKKLAQKLTKIGMRAIFKWTGMGLTINAPIENDLPKSTKIKTVSNTSELNSWLHILNTALMTSNKIQENIFENLYNQGKFELYLVLENDKPVATGLAFFDDKHCGIYMIATLEEYRNKGLGTAITKQCMNDALNNDINNIVLHASPQGKSIYEKIGFKKYGEFSIYWMLGKEYK